MTDTIDRVETRAFAVSHVSALRNVRAFQDYCDKVGLRIGLHVRTHRSARFARTQDLAGGGQASTAGDARGRVI